MFKLVLKKLVMLVALVIATLTLSRSFRDGFKEGLTDEANHQTALGRDNFLLRKFRTN